MRLCHPFLLAAALLMAAPSYAASKKVTISGKIAGAAGSRVLLVAKSGEIKSVTLRGSGAFSFAKVPASFLKSASLQVVAPSGVYDGAVVLIAKKKKARIFFSGKITSATLKLGTIKKKSGYYKLAKSIGDAVVAKQTAKASSSGVPIGAGKSGLVLTAATSSHKLSIRAADSGDGDGDGRSTTSPGADSDSDGIVDAFDADDDGDANLDATDSDSASTTAHDNPFTTLYLSSRQTLNVNTGLVTAADIDTAISEYSNLIIYQSLAPDSTVASGHVVCPASLEYCRSAADGGATALYTGVSESSDSVRNQTWSNYNADGSGYPNLEPITQGSDHALVAGVQPRVGTSKFHAGDVFQLVLSNSSGATVSTKTLTLAPYFVTVPAVKSYNVGAGELDFNYASHTGVGMDTPITVASSASLGLTFWRPQRQAVSGAESGDYRDMGHLHYGVVLSTNSSEFGCAGHYSSLSGLTETPSSSDQSMGLWPLSDASDDATPDSGNTLSFTVDIRACLTEHSATTGTYTLSLTAAGEPLSGGANRAVQTFDVSVQ